MSLERRKEVGGAWGTVPAGTGGSLQTQTATVETDPDTFEAEDHIFDLERVAACRISTTFLTFDPDGETVGSGEGEIGADTSAYEVSRDGVTWVKIVPLTNQWERDVPYDGSQELPYMSNAAYGVTPRYVRAHLVRVVDSFSLDTYAGSNHPVTTARIDVEYL